MKTLYKWTYNKCWRVIEYPYSDPRYRGDKRGLILHQTGDGWCYNIGESVPFHPRDPRDRHAVKLTPAQARRFLLEIKL